MSYCTTDQVQTEFKNNLPLDSGALSTATLEDWISEIDAYINGKLGLKYVVPVTGTEALKICKYMSLSIPSIRLTMGEVPS